MNTRPPSSGPTHGSDGFATTEWTSILEAAHADSETSRQAFARIYERYWYPVYAYVRRRGHTPPEAEDIAQGFFLRLIEKDVFSGLSREGGRFRAFIITCLGNYLANEWNRGRALKRGGYAVTVSLDAEAAETRYGLEPAHAETPELLFERQWALSLLNGATERVAREAESDGRKALFEAVRPHLVGDVQAAGYPLIGERCGMSEGAVRVAVHRFRRRFGELLRLEVARTLGPQGDVEEELRHLIGVLRG